MVAKAFSQKIADIADLLALVMQEPRTKDQIRILTSLDPKTIQRWTAGMHDAGIFYIREWKRPRNGKGAWVASYAMNPRPFHNIDAIHPDDLPVGAKGGPLLTKEESALWAQLVVGDREKFENLMRKEAEHGNSKS